jgi:hypothetical protein
MAGLGHWPLPARKVYTAVMQERTFHLRLELATGPPVTPHAAKIE